MVRGNVDSLVKLIAAFDAAGIEMIDEGAASHRAGARGAAEGRLGLRPNPSAGAMARMISAVALQMSCVAALLATAILAIVLSRSERATAVIYGATLAVCLVALFGVAAVHCSAAPLAPPILTLPLGLPWLGAHFRLDALAAFFLVVVNLGGAAASLYGLGYGHHEPAPHRVLPFFPAFLAGMNLVVLADDAFSFLLCWEFMSLASWALVMAHHREAGNAKAGYVYLVMASFGTLALLLAFGLLAGPAGDYGFRRHPRGAAHALCGGAGADPDAARRRLEGRPGAAARLAAARPSGGAQPRLGADERRHDQGRDLRLHSRRVRSAGTADLVVERGRAFPRQHHRRAWASSTP